MTRFVPKCFVLVLGASLSLLAVVGADLKAPETDSEKRPDKPFRPVTPGLIDGRVAFVTGKMLEQLQYSRQKFNEAISSKFFDHYFEAFDPQHLHFLQSDIARLEPYRTNLDKLTLASTGLGDTRPACQIFNLFVQRLAQRVAYVDELLKTEKFTFDTDEKVVINRRDAPYPKDVAEARNLWRERLRFEYLQEKLGKIDARKKAASAKDASKDSTESKTPKKTDEEDIFETLSHRYHRNLRMFQEWDNEDVLQVYLTTLAHVYDPHSDYFGHSQLDTFAIGMNLSLFGIGAELGSEDGYCTIRRLLPGGPAAKSKKIKEKDRIVAVAQSNQPPVDVVDMNLNKAVQLIRGPKGTEVRLTMIPAGSSERVTLSLIRDEIKLEDQEAKAKIIDLPDAQGETVRVGVIDLPSFYASFDPANNRGKSEPKSTTADVAKLLMKLKQEKVRGIILDLRRNGGGSLEEAVSLTGLFIKEGPVVQIRDANPKSDPEEKSDTDPSVLYDGPMIVLTSRFSASASEILAGALQDYGRAVIVGDISTHGKGTVQSVQPLQPHMHLNSSLMTNDPGALKVTIKKFYRPSGASTQLKGVEPDIVLPSVLNVAKDIGESALENPMPWDTIDPAKYQALDLVAPSLGQLRQKSAQRVATEREYDYTREDMGLAKKAQEDKAISLNQKQRLKEKEESDARQKARDKERLARKEPQEKVYELTVRLAEQPGLPAPVQKTNAALAKAASLKIVPLDAGTNSLAANPTPAPTAPAGDDETEEEKPPAVDANMVEAQHILTDYIALLSKGGTLTAGH